MKKIHLNEYITMLLGEYQKVSTRSLERPKEDSIVSFKCPHANNKNDSLALRKLLELMKQQNSNEEE